MANPVMNQLESDLKKTPAGYPTMPGYQVGNQQIPGTATTSASAASSSGYGAQNPNQVLSPQVSFPDPADSSPSRAMTLDDVILRTGLCFGILLLSGVASWYLTTKSLSLGMGLMFVGLLVGMGAVLFASFKATPSPALTITYAVAEGLVLGAFSMVMEYQYPGIVIQAVIGTAAVFATCLVLFKTGLVRVNGKFMKILLVGLIGVLVYRIVAMILSATGVLTTSADYITVAGLPLGLVVGVLAVLLGAMSLISDFDVAREGIRLGAPKETAWRCALGLMVTIVWLYVELLRLLQIMRSLSD